MTQEDIIFSDKDIKRLQIYFDYIISKVPSLKPVLNETSLYHIVIKKITE